MQAVKGLVRKCIGRLAVMLDNLSDDLLVRFDPECRDHFTPDYWRWRKRERARRLREGWSRESNGNR
jgi:hypothetical protein